jgi:DNA-binding IclR family transcriptional regulator
MSASQREEYAGKAPLSGMRSRLSPAVVRACSILTLVASRTEPTRVSDIVLYLNIPRNSAFELVRTLTNTGLLDTGADHALRLGLRLFELGYAYEQSLDLIAEAKVVAKKLAIASGETVHVAVLDGRDVVYLVKEESQQFVRISSVGRRLPAHVTGVGKAMLAFRPEAEVRRLLGSAALAALTPRSITDRIRLSTELASTRNRGYAVDSGEAAPDVRCVAAPIRNGKGEVVAAISISSPAYRTDSAKRAQFIRQVIQAATDISSRLGQPAQRSSRAEAKS